MIIPTTVLILVQTAIVTWIILTNPEPCPKEYLKYNNAALLFKYCEITPSGLGYTWSLREEYEEE